MSESTCPICGAPSPFQRGDHVMLNHEWERACGGETYAKYPVGRKGVIVLDRGRHLIPLGCVRVRFDGQKRSTIFHQTFLTKI